MNHCKINRAMLVCSESKMFIIQDFFPIIKMYYPIKPDFIINLMKQFYSKNKMNK